MDAIIWTDVRGHIAQPMMAHDASQGTRQVATRLWRTPEAEKPYQIHCRLIEDGAEVESWENDYTAAAFTGANRAYVDVQARAVRWLNGETLLAVRPYYVRAR